MTAAQAPIRAALVDLDGTLVDTIGDFELALGATLDGLGLPRVGRAFIERTVGKGSGHLLRSTLAEAGGDAAAQFDAAWAAYQQHYLAINGQGSTVYPGVVEGLAALRALGLKLACLTNKPGSFARPLLAAKGLDGFFDAVFGGDAFARNKPDPLPLIETCRHLGVAPAAAVMIGDSANDAAAARAAGCRVLLLPYGYNHGEPIAGVEATAHVADLVAAARWIGAPSAADPGR